jgi:hypothetical protein
VTEHAARLLCAACLRKALVAAAPRRKSSRAVAVVLLLAGLLLSWVFFLGFAGGLSELTARMERVAWQNR